jgi:peroxiredoxin
MPSATSGALGPGDLAPDFELPAADRDGQVSLADVRRRGPVLLVMLRGLYCPFCRRHISQLRPACDTLKEEGIQLLGVVVASAARARQYFGYRPPCFPIAAAPDRRLHRAYGLPSVERSAQFLEETQRLAAEANAELGIVAPPGEAGSAFMKWDGFEMTAEDGAEHERPLQFVGYFLVGRDGVIRWARVSPREGSLHLPKVEELPALL